MVKYDLRSEFISTNVEGIQVIPKEWRIKQVRYLLKDGAEGIKIGPFGSALKLEDMVDAGFSVYGQENVIKKDFSLGKRKISEAKFQEMSVYRIFPKDILITMMGTSGKCEIVPSDIGEGIIDSHLLRVRVKEDQILPEFFKLLIDKSPEISYQIQVFGKGSIMHGLNSGIVKSLNLPLPSIEEQKLILNFLDHETSKIDSLIEKQQQLIQLLKEKRQAVISHAVTKGLDPHVKMKDSGVEWLGDVPEHWEVLPIKYLTKCVGTGGTPKNQISFTEVPEINWFTPGDFSGDLEIIDSSKYVTFSSVKDGDSKLYEGKSVLMIGIGATLGKVAISNKDFSCNQQINVLTCNKLITPEFLTFSLMSQLEQIKQLSNSSTIGIINQEKTKQICISVPTVEEQSEIIHFIMGNIEKFNNLINKAESAIQLMQERRTALISAAVTGKIDVRNWQNPTEAKMEFSA